VVYIIRFAQQLIAGRDIPAKSHGREKHANTDDQSPPAGVPGLNAKPEVQTYAGMQPDRQHRRDLQKPEPRR
jgi:hypothetical protein